MNNIISFLLIYIQMQTKIIYYLVTLLIGKPSKSPYDEPIKKDYRKLQIDSMPIIEKLDKLDYQQILNDYYTRTSKSLKPISRRNDSSVSVNIKCPKCNAPHEYIYDNNGAKGQYQCKICKTTFSKKNRFLKEVIFRCPHCSKVLEKVKVRNDFNIFKCKNKSCCYYLKNLSSMSKTDKLKYKQNPESFKLHYIFREFNFDFKPLSKQSIVRPKVDLSKIHSSQHVLGLILSYNVNFGISSRATTQILKDIHGVKISHQTVLNYAHASAQILKPYIDNYPYDLTSSMCGDETYIKVNGKWHYVFFIFDSIKKIITSYPVSAKRDTLTAIKAIDSTLAKYTKIPNDLRFVFDGNPIYLLAQQYFFQNDIHFDIKQVIGLKNEDLISKEYRPFKQVIERLNRTLKSNYKQTNGFNSFRGSNTFLTLFVAFFNFLRPHRTLNFSVPVQIPELHKLETMPSKWLKLIELSQKFICSQL